METDFENSPTHAIDKDTLLALFSGPVPPSGVGVATKPASASWEAEDELFADENPGEAPGAHARPSELDEADFFDHHGNSELQAGRYREARVLHEKAMELRRRALGEEDPHLARSFCNLGALAFHQGRLEEAEWHFRQAREVADKRGLGREPQMGLILNNLGVLAGRRGDFTESRACYEAALEIKSEALGWQHTSVAATLINLGRLAERVGELRDALNDFARARAICELREGAMGPTLAAALLGLGRVQLRRGGRVQAAFAFDRALRIREAIPCSPAQLASVRFFTAMALADQDPVEARTLVVEAIRDYRASESPRSENLEAMISWLSFHDMRMLRRAS